MGDDLVALTSAGGRYLARPGYPLMRMWPEQARHFDGHDALEQVHPGLTKRRVPVGTGGFGAFDGAMRPPAALYLPARRDGGDIAFETMPPAQALFELVRHTFLVGIIEGAGLAIRHFAALAEVVRRAPLRVVRYPNGLDLLPDVGARIANDARALARDD